MSRITFGERALGADVRTCVELAPVELPWPLRFYFLRNEDLRWDNVGFEMGVGPITRGTLEEGIELEPLAPSAVRWFQENFFYYRSLAESELNTDVSIRRRGTSESPESLAYLAAQYEKVKDQRGAIQWLADSWGVNRSTIWRRLNKAGVQRSFAKACDGA